MTLISFAPTARRSIGSGACSVGPADRFDYRVYHAYAGDLPGAVGDCDGYLITDSASSVVEEAPWM